MRCCARWSWWPWCSLPCSGCSTGRSGERDAARLLTLALAAIVVTTTTPVNDMLDAFIRWISPLRRLGVDPERVALTVGSRSRPLPGNGRFGAIETRDAARARGCATPRRHLTPFVIRVVARAHRTGDALQARGIGTTQPLMSACWPWQRRRWCGLVAGGRACRDPRRLRVAAAGTLRARFACDRKAGLRGCGAARLALLPGSRSAVALGVWWRGSTWFIRATTLSAPSQTQCKHPSDRDRMTVTRTLVVRGSEPGTVGGRCWNGPMTAIATNRHRVSVATAHLNAEARRRGDASVWSMDPDETGQTPPNGSRCWSATGSAAPRDADRTTGTPTTSRDGSTAAARHPTTPTATSPSTYGRD